MLEKKEGKFTDCTTRNGVADISGGVNRGNGSFHGKVGGLSFNKP